MRKKLTKKTKTRGLNNKICFGHLFWLMAAKSNDTPRTAQRRFSGLISSKACLVPFIQLWETYLLLESGWLIFLPFSCYFFDHPLKRFSNPTLWLVHLGLVTHMWTYSLSFFLLSTFFQINPDKSRKSR